ncbi:MAG: YndJ family transporter [Bacteroidota bacterium]
MNIRLQSILGFVIWLIWLFLNWPIDPFQLTYVSALILAAPLWLLPIAWQLTSVSQKLIHACLPAATLLSTAFLLEQGWVAAMLSVPWLVLTMVAAFQKWRFRKRRIFRKPADLCHLVAYLYLPVGAIWAVADRLGFQPMGFSPAIVLLTVAHFHYAGFMLPLLSGWAVGNLQGSWLRLSAYGVALGVPLTAIGITAAQFDMPAVFELIPATIMALSGMLTAWAHWILFRTYPQAKGRYYWLFAGTALFGGMLLALLYGWRSVFPISFLSIPWMHAIHGSLNAAGFALPALLGWHLHLNHSPSRRKKRVVARRMELS